MERMVSTWLHAAGVTMAVAGGVALNASAAKAIEFGLITVQQNTTANTAAAITLTTSANTAGFAPNPVGPTNRADYGVIIGGTVADDAANGILLATVANNGRDNGEGSTLAGIRYGVAGADLSSGGWFIPVHDVLTGAEYNFDVAAVYFPFAEGWIAAHARNSAGTNGGDLNQILTGTGAAAITLGGSTGNRLVAPGTSLAPVTTANGGTSGRADLFLAGVNALTDGLLFVTHGKNEANYALSRPSPDGSRFEIGIHDSNVNGAAYEQDPIALAYVPYGTANVTMGRIVSWTSGSSTISRGVMAGTSQGEFHVRRVDAGAYELKVAGATTTDGVLFVSPEGFDSWNNDNIVTYAPLADGSGWRIETRDLPLGTATTGIAGQDTAAGEAIFNFMFVRADSPPTAPGTRLGYRTNRVAAANYNVVEFTSGNGAADMTAAAASGTSGMGLSGVNRGDNKPAIGGASIVLNTTAASADVLLASTSQGFRDNPFGADGYGLATVWNDNGTYTLATANNGDSEINVNFAAALFPATAGFVQAPSVATASGRATIPLDPAAGLLMATPLVNAGILATVDVTGSGHVVNVVGGTGTRTSTTPFGYVFLPNDTPGLVSGRVTGPTGTITIGADTESATLTRTATGVYTLSLAGGRTPDTGMLLLNALAADSEFDNFAVWEKNGTDFTIRVLDAAATPTAVDGDFQFAYIPYDQSLAKSSDLSPATASVDFGKALVGASVTAAVGASATSPHSYTITSFTAGRTGGSAALSATAGTARIRGDTPHVAAGGSIDVGLVANASGPLEATLSLVNLTDGSDTGGNDFTATLDAYEPALLAKGQATAVSSGGLVSLTNAAAGGTQRAAARAFWSSLSGDAGWSVSGFDPGTTIAAGSSLTGTATFDPAGRLNGTYSATFAVDLEHADLSIFGTSPGDLGQITWSLSHLVTGRTADSGQADRDVGQSYEGLGLSRGQGRGTAAAILHGEAGGSRTVQFGFRDAAAAPVLSDILDLTGTAGDAIVLSVSYDPTLLVGVAESSLLLGWLDEGFLSPTFGQWVPAVDGNGFNPVVFEAPVVASWQAWWSDFQVANPGSPLSAAVGAFGVDPVARTAWAVVDHNSSFAVIAVPEPAMLPIVAAGGAGVLRCLIRRRRKDA